jgi:NADH-quinone oxidoreductase subunit N
MVYLWPYMRERGLYKGEMSILMLFAVLGMMLLVSADSLVMVYVGLEMLALCSYALVAIDRDNPLASEAGIKYFVLGALASGLLLYGLSLVYGATGTLDLGEIAAAAQSTQSMTMLVTGVVFMVAGIGFKFGAAPFHMWLPDVYHGAPTPITLFIGSAPKLAAFGMTYRLLEVAVGPLQAHWQLMLAALAVLSLAIGNLGAIMQSNFKRLLAYSTVSHVGFLFLGFAGGGPEGFAAAMFYALVYALMAAAAFGAVVVMSSRGFEADRIDDYRGLNARNPWLAGLVMLIMFSMAGVPPFLGFWAKLAVLRAAIEGGMMWLAIVGVVFAVIGAFYYLKVVKVMYFDEPGNAMPAPSGNRPMRIVFGVNAVALLALGFAWSPIMAWCQRAFGI